MKKILNRIVFRIFNITLLLAVMLAGCTKTDVPNGNIETVNPATETPSPPTYYVSPTGSDSNPGTASAPFKTLSRGVSILNPGDILIVSGTFNEQFDISSSGTASAHIKYIGKGAVIDTSSAKGIAITASYVDVSGFEVEHAVEHGLWNVGQHNIIENNIVHDSVTENGTNGNCTLISSGGWGSGISIKFGSDDVTVRNNQSYNNCGEGLAVTRGANVVVDGNNVHDNFSVNIYIDNSHDLTVQNNTVICTNFNLRDGNRATGIADGAESYSGWGYQRYNNYFYQNTVKDCYDGIAVWEGEVEGVTSNIQVKGNVIPTGIRRSISIVSPSNQNVVVQDNQVFVKPYTLDQAGVTLLDNALIGQ
jgi:parallel beta-helix repeat protein